MQLDYHLFKKKKVLEQVLRNENFFLGGGKKKFLLKFKHCEKKNLSLSKIDKSSIVFIFFWNDNLF
jgi:hypothetical protein